ncbi:PIN domain-containing protein [Butyrivibrio sp. XPD2006]|uniref:PIN domain-containing protein n=1 Tax=Butyrivibrio sp. XPD2006 TaxID=1280668 RepID=UPI0003B4A327|nr:PIN domain-containing protein [Butyrivibrio sp. XPD2006]
MATIFVDYENVHRSYGLRGAEYLNKGDKLFVFYSNVCDKIHNDDLIKIERSQCDFKIHKLVNSGKNALDFYIATKIGIEYQKGERQIVIVTGDKGFDAVVDFINSIPTTLDRKIIRSCNIERGLVALNDSGNSQRRRLIADGIALKDIAEAQAYIQAKADFLKNIERILKGTKFESDSDKIIDFIGTDSRPSKKTIYSNYLHEYGMKEGLELYRMIKEVV